MSILWDEAVLEEAAWSDFGGRAEQRHGITELDQGQGAVLCAVTPNRGVSKSAPWRVVGLTHNSLQWGGERNAVQSQNPLGSCSKAPPRYGGVTI